MTSNTKISPKSKIIRNSEITIRMFDSNRSEAGTTKNHSEGESYKTRNGKSVSLVEDTED